MATRTHAREMVVELLYAYTMGNERIFDFADELLGAKKIRNAQADFAKGLFKGVVAHLQKIDSIIEANLKSWEISRLGVIDKCILRLGVYEILNAEIDAPVAINEAIEIAKILGAENTGKFVNGVLDAISKGGFDLIKGVEFHKNSSLGMQFRTKSAESALDSANSQNLEKNNSCKAPKNSPASWCKKSESKGAEVPPADFLLEAEKRGSPPKSEKRQLLARRGSGAGGAALLREKTSESKKPKSDRFAKSAKSQNSRKDSKGGLLRAKRTRNDNIKSAKSAPFRHSEGAKRPKNPRITSKSFLDSSPTAQNDSIVKSTNPKNQKPKGKK